MKYATLIGFAVVALSGFTACFDDGTGPQQPAVDLTTPANTLETVERAFNDRDLRNLTVCLGEDFSFHFDQHDVGEYVDGFEIPPSWGRDDHLAVCGNMFDDAHSVDLSLSTSGIINPDEGATEFTAENVQIRLLVMVDATNGFMAQGFCDFGFVNVGTGDDEDWVVCDWWDKTGYDGTLVSPRPWSLGRILVLFK